LIVAVVAIALRCHQATEIEVAHTGPASPPGILLAENLLKKAKKAL